MQAIMLLAKAHVMDNTNIALYGHEILILPRPNLLLLHAHARGLCHLYLFRLRGLLSHNLTERLGHVIASIGQNLLLVSRETATLANLNTL
jgi:hypothetical protein